MALAEVAAADFSTRVGAEIVGWSYPASQQEVLTIISQFGKEAKNILPFDPDQMGETVSAEERVEVEQKLEEQFTFI